MAFSVETTKEGTLIDIIGAGVSKGGGGDSFPVLINLEDGRKITASYDSQTNKKGFMYGDVDVKEDVVWDGDLIRPHLDALLKDGKPFYVVTGTHDMVLSLKWEISTPQ